MDINRERFFQAIVNDSSKQRGQVAAVIVDDANVSSVAQSKWIPELGLSNNNDHECLLSDGWVTDSIVNAAQTLY